MPINTIDFLSKIALRTITLRVWKALQALIPFMALMALNACLVMSMANAQTYYLGVLAPQGETVAQERWQPWLNQLNEQLQEDTVVLVPLALENWQQEIEAQQFALVLGPQVQLIKMNTTHWRWLATLQADTAPAKLTAPADINGKNFNEKGFNEKGFSKTADKQFSATVNLANEFNKLSQGSPLKEPSAMEEVASALWVKADSGIYQLQDLQQRKIAAVDAEAFGGYLLVAHLLQQNGVPSNRYQTQFVGYPIERTLNALANGSVDAAIAPLCLMEEMARQGKVSEKQYRLIHPVATTSSCQSSTPIYPNWTLAATEQAPNALVRQINQNLFGTSQSEQELLGINQGWLPPESSSNAERILYDMNRHPAQKQLGAHMVEWVKAHRLWMAVIVLIILISTVNYAWMSWLAWRRRQKITLQNRLIRDYDQQLRQSERFAVIGEMSGSIAHEINQPLATIQNYAQGLLIRSQNSQNSQSSQEWTGLDNNSVNSLHAVEKSLTDKQATETALQQIVNETERVAAVISNIRRWAGRSQPDEVRVDIATTYEQCILLLGEKASAMSFWLTSDYPSLQLPNLVLDQLLMNSMVNAEQQGATQIMLRCQAEDYNGKSYIVLHMTDDAGGFDEAQLLDHKPLTGNKQLVDNKSQQRLPNRYATKSTKANGLGLGLMICQRLCKSLGGMMRLSNIEVQQELNCIQALDGYQQRFKRNLNGKVRLMNTESTYPLANKIGAQVSFYLPLHLADNAEK